MGIGNMNNLKFFFLRLFFVKNIYNNSTDGQPLLQN